MLLGFFSVAGLLVVPWMGVHVSYAVSLVEAVALIEAVVPLKEKRCLFAWLNFHFEVEKRICLVEFSYGRAVLSLGILSSVR